MGGGVLAGNSGLCLLGCLAGGGEGGVRWALLPFNRCLLAWASCRNSRRIVLFCSAISCAARFRSAVQRNRSFSASRQYTRMLDTSLRLKKIRTALPI